MVVSSPRVPARIRQALNVEAGLNDGLSGPFLMLFIALVLLSVFVHGFSALPGIAWYSRWLEKLKPNAAEREEVAEVLTA